MHTRENIEATCSVCSKTFQPKFSFQKAIVGQEALYFCSQQCLLQAKTRQEKVPCSVCGQPFTPQFAFQKAMVNNEPVHYCSMQCAKHGQMTQKRKQGRKRRIAVVNQKGGTGKTTTAINLAAGFAAKGLRVLLIDMDAQGNVGVSLGIQGERTTRELLMNEAPIELCAVPIRADLDIITCNETLADIEHILADKNPRATSLQKMLIENNGETDYDIVVLDCPPALSHVNRNALMYADEVIVPVACDFLSMVGVKQIMKTLRTISKIKGTSVDIGGVLPTFFDTRTNLSHEVLRNLKEYFKEKLLPPIRISTKLKEAPIHKKTIFEYAPDNHAAIDYLAVVEKLLA